MSTSPPQNPQGISAEVSHPELKEGDPVAYSNHLVVSHTPWEFTLNFFRIDVPVKIAAGSDHKVHLDSKRVATLIVPANMMPNVVRAVRENLENYESPHGKIQPQPKSPPS